MNCEHGTHVFCLVDIPRFIQDLSDQIVPATEDANFTCTGQGYGDVTVSWFRGRRRGNPIQDKAFITNITIPDLITSVLSIPNVLASDEGRYWCRLSNNAGSNDSNIAQLTIGGKTNIRLLVIYNCYCFLQLVHPE